MPNASRDHHDASLGIHSGSADRGTRAAMANDDADLHRDCALGNSNRFLAIALIVAVSDGEAMAQQTTTPVEITNDLLDTLADWKVGRLLRVRSRRIRDVA
jgi:hypothetical protein